MEKSKKVTVHAYKYNGWLYRTWEFPTVYEETDEYVCVSSQGAHVITASPNNNKFYHSKITHSTIWYFFKKQWFNIIVARKNKHYYYYINIASPFIYENEVIKYIDFDLDFKIPDTNVENIYELDVDEFNENKIKYNYSSEIIGKILEAEKLVKTKYHNKELNKFLNPDVMKKQDENYQNKRNYGRHN